MVLRRSRKEVVRAPAGPPRVLVVRDDPDSCELLVRLLGVAGFEVERADDFLSMTRVLAERPPFACVVLDVGAGGGIGANLKLLDTLRGSGDRAVATTRVVLISTGARSDLFSWQAGADELVTRPFHIDDLVAAIRRALDRPDEERARYRPQQLDAAARAGTR